MLGDFHFPFSASPSLGYKNCSIIHVKSFSPRAGKFGMVCGQCMWVLDCHVPRLRCLRLRHFLWLGELEHQSRSTSDDNVAAVCDHLPVHGRCRLGQLHLHGERVARRAARAHAFCLVWKETDTVQCNYPISVRSMVAFGVAAKGQSSQGPGGHSYSQRGRSRATAWTDGR